MERYTAGLDVHSRNTVFTIQDASGKVVRRGDFKTSAEGVAGWVERSALPSGTQVGLESGSQAFLMARLLWQAGLVPVVIDAREVRVKAHRPTQKCDKRDAFEICDGLRREIYRSVVHVPPPDIETLRRTLSRRRHFVKLKSMQVHAVKFVLCSQGQRSLYRTLQTDKAWKQLKARVQTKAPHCAAMVEMHHEMWCLAYKQVDKLNALLEKQCAPYQEMRHRLQQIPGVGPVVSATLIAVLSDATRFPSCKHVASYAGLVPSMHSSGDKDKHGRITKCGSSELRCMLCEAALSSRRMQSPLHPFYRKWTVRRGHKVAIIAVAHLILRVAWSMMRSGQDFSLSKLGIEAGDFEKKITAHYRIVGRVPQVA